MSMNYVANMMFQKEHFPEIYKSYMLPVSDSVPDCEVRVKELVYFYLYVDEKINLLLLVEELFNACIDYDLSVSVCKVDFGYIDKVVSFENGILQIEANHPYLNKNKPIILSHSIVPDLLNQSYAFYTYKAKPLKQLTELKIKKFCRYDYKTHNLMGRDDFLACLIDASPEYLFLFHDNEKEKRVYLRDYIQVGEVSLKLIEVVNSALDLKENKILQECTECVMYLFSSRALELLSRQLESGEFNTNYILVEKYLSYEYMFEDELTNRLKNGLIPSIRELKKMVKSSASLYNAISTDKNILELDDFVKVQLEKFYNLLEEI